MSKCRGVTWRKDIQKWQAQIRIDGKNTHLGVFSDRQDAAMAYEVAASKRPCRPGLEQRFHDKVLPEPMTGCWLWLSNMNAEGYGLITVSKRSLKAHRVAYELVNGPIPDGMHIDHKCHTPQCVNPEHLRLCTRSQNAANSSKQKSRSSTYKGVSFARRQRKWVAYITLERTRRHLGFFSEEIDAARAYDKAAQELFGQFALCNFFSGGQ